METIRLLAIDGTLYFPHGGGDITQSNDWNGERGEPKMLLQIYPAGDCDRCEWPMVDTEYATVEEQRKRLAAALFDEREGNVYFPLRCTIELPDGSPFDFDLIVE